MYVYIYVGVHIYTHTYAVCVGLQTRGDSRSSTLFFVVFYFTLFLIPVSPVFNVLTDFP